MQFLACIASVSARVRRESWDESKKDYLRTCANFTSANKIAAIHEIWHVSVKVESRSTSRLSSTLCLASILFLIKIYLRVHARKNYTTVEERQKKNTFAKACTCTLGQDVV